VFTTLSESVSEFSAPTHLGIPKNAGVGNIGNIFENLIGQFPMLQICLIFWNMAFNAPLLIIDPFLWQGQFCVQQASALWRCITGKNPNLAVILLAGPPAPLPLHTNRLLPLLGKSRGVYA